MHFGIFQPQAVDYFSLSTTTSHQLCKLLIGCAAHLPLLVLPNPQTVWLWSFGWRLTLTCFPQYLVYWKHHSFHFTVLYFVHKDRELGYYPFVGSGERVPENQCAIIFRSVLVCTRAAQDFCQPNPNLLVFLLISVVSFLLGNSH